MGEPVATGTGPSKSGLPRGLFKIHLRFKGGKDVRCPTCGRESVPDWRFFQALTPERQEWGGKTVSGLARGRDPVQQVALEWMRCAWEECQQLIIRIHDSQVEGYIDGTAAPLIKTGKWIVYPRFGEVTREIDPLVRDPYKTDYLEAAAILDTSHRMSAVLARRIMSDLLRKYGKHEQRRLTQQIDAFTSEPGHPSRLTENLHHFREVGDFGAHTQQDENETVINVDRDEAEWTLDLVDRLFDYFIVQPEKDAALRRRIGEKGKRAGRTPLDKEGS
jgi:hypothetical protein